MERTGTDRERDEISELFKQQNFDVRIHNNKTVQEIELEILDLASADHSECGMLIIFFLTYADGTLVWGRDNYFELATLHESFKECRSLAGKPKLIFIQLTTLGETLTIVPAS